MAGFVGRQFGDYKIIEEIGAEGMGQVFLAENVHHRSAWLNVLHGRKPGSRTNGMRWLTGA